MNKAKTICIIVVAIMIVTISPLITDVIGTDGTVYASTFPNIRTNKAIYKVHKYRNASPVSRGKSPQIVPNPLQ